MTEIERFNKAILENKELLQEVTAIGNDVGRIVEFANAKGYAFSVGDLESTLKKGAVLSEDELENVSGGFLTALAGMSFQIGDDGLTIGAKAKAIAVL